MMALTFAGITFPDFGMPLLARIFGQLFPLSYWLRIFTGQTLRADPLAISIENMALLFVFIAMGAVSLYWLKEKYRNEKYWGRN